jgi:predicted  nucleic acid-binding Zn-ribbon protein
MGSLEERVAYLEGRGEEHAAAIHEVRADIRDLRSELRDFRVEVNGRFDHTDDRFDHMEGRFERLETRFDTRFMWLIGFQFATLMAVIAALLNVYVR